MIEEIWLLDTEFYNGRKSLIDISPKALSLAGRRLIIWEQKLIA